MSPVIALNILDRPVILKTEAPASQIPRGDYITLLHRGNLDLGPFQFRLISRLPETKWSAARLEKNRLSANFQGNPLWPERVLSPYESLSRYFFLKASSSEQSCILPMALTLNSKINDLLGDRFGFQEFEESLTDKDYVDTFIDSGRLPMANPIDRDSVHDWAYHFVTFLFTDYLENVRSNLLWIRKRIHLFQGTTNYSWNYYGHSLNEKGQMEGQGQLEEMNHEAAIYRQMAIALDVATAKFVQLMALEQQGQIERCQAEIQAVGVFLNGVTSESIKTILWMEPSLPFSPPSKEGEPIQTMAYIHTTLAKLDQRARELLKSGETSFYEEIFASTLRRLDPIFETQCLDR